MSNINSVKTLDDLINFTDRYDPVKISYFSLAGKGDDAIAVISTNLFSLYQRYTYQFVKRYKVTDQQRRQFRCRPFLLSTAVYGTPNLAWLIMMLNNQECPSKFKLKQYIDLIPIEALDELYDTIVTRHKKKLDANRTEIFGD